MKHLILLSIFSGILMKLTDDLIDKKKNQNNLLVIIGGMLYGLSIGFLMTSDKEISILFWGIVLGCLITKKIDNMGHYIALFWIIVIYLLYGMRLSLLVLLITLFSAMDELKDFVKIPEKLNFIFEYRLILKIAILILVLIGVLHYFTLMVLLAFDISYIITGKLTQRYLIDV